MTLAALAAFVCLSATANSAPVEFPKGAAFPPPSNCGVAVGPDTIAIFYLSDDGKQMEAARFRTDPFTLLQYKYSATDAVGIIAEHCREAARSAGVSRGHWGAILEASEYAKQYLK